MRLFGLIGYPLSHSFSKRYFTEKFKQEKRQDCRYELFPLQSITELTSLLDDNPFLEGLNVTIPYKKQVLGFLHEKKGIPAGLEACNCIRIREGQLSGYNTDVIGFRKSLQPLLQPQHKKALILGNGGAAAAVAHVLRQQGIICQVVSRELQRGSSLTYQGLDKGIMEEYNLIINTTPLGMYPNEDNCPAIPYEFLSKGHLLYDLVYNPVKTLFLKRGEEQGAAIKNGEEMLVLQAEESWRIWNGV